MRDRSVLRAGILFFAIYLMTACGGGLSSEQRGAANDALKALRKVEAATQVGVNYQQYGQLAIDAKAAVNQAVAALPDGELKSEIVAAMEAYADAGDAWGAAINDKLYSGSKLAGDLKQKYDFDYQRANAALSKDDLKSLMLSTIWGTARDRLNKATSLLDKKQSDWKFPARGVAGKDSNGSTVYELGDEFKASHTQSPKKGHMVSVGVPSSVYEKAKQTTSDENEIGKLIAWETFKKACYPMNSDFSRDFIGSYGKELPIYKFRMASGETAYITILIGNNALFKGSMVFISKNPLGEGEEKTN
jgi:hypothetical protein